MDAADATRPASGRATIADQVKGTEGSAASPMQAASSIDQLTTTVYADATDARQASQLASDASRVAKEGGLMVADVVTTTEAMNAKAKKIGDIIGVIDGIAFRTHILAL